MAQSQQSAHARVGLLLTQVRGEFLRVSTSDPEGPARAAQALRRAFGLLNCCGGCCHRWRQEDPAADDDCYQGCGEEQGEQQSEELDSDTACVRSKRADGCSKQDADKMLVRMAFLESSYLPFASLLLREVGPVWLPVWDSIGPAAAPAGRLAPRLQIGGTVIAAAASAPTAALPGALTDAAAADGCIRRSGAAPHPTLSSPRSYFEAFFLPPAVPASLALLALCEGLGRPAPESATIRPLMSTPQSSNSGGGGGGEEWLPMARLPPKEDARVVQFTCQLMEPYLRESLEPQSQMVPYPYPSGSRPAESGISMAAVSGGMDRTNAAAATAIQMSSVVRSCTVDGTASSGTALVQSDSWAASTSQGQQQRQPDGTGRVPLLVEAVMELSDGVRGCGGETEKNIAAGVGDREKEGEGGVFVNVRSCAFVGAGAAETLASALCFAPQRVANNLGPIAPPNLSPDVFFPTVCRAVVNATLNICSRSAAPLVPAVAAAGDVWREFTGRLLSVGRASDLAEAWLGAMAAAQPTDLKKQRHGGDGDGGDESVAWLAWTEEPGGAAEAHAWMMTRLPASRRRPFTEALMSALWPRDGSARRRPRQAHEWQPQLGTWPPGFRKAACRVLIGRPLLMSLLPANRRLPLQQRHEGAGVSGGGGGRQSDAGGGGHGGRGPRSAALGEAGSESPSSANEAVGILEGLLLQRPLPPAAADAIAEILAWCDRRGSRAAGPGGVATSFGAASGGSGDGESGGETGWVGGRAGLLMGTLKRVAAVWAEPSFLNRCPLRQQELYTRFLLAALRSGGLDGQLGGADGDQEALVLLIRGVGSHLDVPARETRLRGMRVGEAVAALGGQELRFDELDGEREERRRQEEGADAARALGVDDMRQAGNGDVEDGEVGKAPAGVGSNSRRRTKSRRKEGSGGTRRKKGGPVVNAAEEKKKLWRRLPTGWGGGGGAGGGDDDDSSDLNPDMLLPLGGFDSGSDSELGDRRAAGGDALGGEGSTGDRDSSSPWSSTEDSSSADDEEGGMRGRGAHGETALGDGGGGFAGGSGGDDDDSLEAYDLWDEQDDLAKVAEPVYLDQLIELLRSRDQPDSADKHETALKCAETLVRRNPPDLAHRALELSRDLLYLEDSFDLQNFEALRSGAMVATTTAAPESCALYLGSEVWGTGATEGTKLKILDVLVQAASELAGWTKPSAGDDNGGVGGVGRGLSSFGESSPSALMLEARGAAPQGSVRRQRRREQQQTQTLKEGKSPPGVAAAGGSISTGGTTGGAAVATTGTEARGGTDDVGSGSSSVGGGSLKAVDGRPAAGTTRRWGYRRGPREQLRRNLFGRFAPVFFYPLAHGMVLRLRESATLARANSARDNHHSLEDKAGRTTAATAGDPEPAITITPYTLPSPTPPPPPSPLFSARLLHCLTCLVELCGSCPATPALASDLLGLAWLLREAASDSRELRRAVLIAVATGIERSHDGAASGAVQGQQGEFLRWLQACAQVPDGPTRELAGAVLGHSSVQALAYM